jgi:hypothetical protein
LGKPPCGVPAKPRHWVSVLLLASSHDIIGVSWLIVGSWFLVGFVVCGGSCSIQVRFCLVEKVRRLAFPHPSFSIPSPFLTLTSPFLLFLSVYLFDCCFCSYGVRCLLSSRSLSLQRYVLFPNCLSSFSSSRLTTSLPSCCLVFDCCLWQCFVSIWIPSANF